MADRGIAYVGTGTYVPPAGSALPGAMWFVTGDTLGGVAGNALTGAVWLRKNYVPYMASTTYIGSCEMRVRVPMLDRGYAIRTGRAEFGILIRQDVRGERLVGGQAEMAVSSNFATLGHGERVVSGQVEMRLAFSFAGYGTPVVSNLGSAWTTVVLDNVSTGVVTHVGGAEIGFDLETKVTGVIEPGAITSIQHQGAAVLAIRDSVTEDGRTMPLMTLPPAVHQGGAQMTFGVAVTPGQASDIGDTPVTLIFGWEAGGQRDAQGNVLAQPEQLGVEFTVRPGFVVIVDVPPVIDWKYLRAYNHTEEEGDAEFFGAAAPDGATSAEGFGWR